MLFSGTQGILLNSVTESLTHPGESDSQFLLVSESPGSAPGAPWGFTLTGALELNRFVSLSFSGVQNVIILVLMLSLCFTTFWIITPDMSMYPQLLNVRRLLSGMIH